SLRDFAHLSNLESDLKALVHLKRPQTTTLEEAITPNLVLLKPYCAIDANFSTDIDVYVHYWGLAIVCAQRFSEFTKICWQRSREFRNQYARTDAISAPSE